MSQCEEIKYWFLCFADFYWLNFTLMVWNPQHFCIALPSSPDSNWETRFSLGSGRSALGTGVPIASTTAGKKGLTVLLSSPCHKEDEVASGAMRWGIDTDVGLRLYMEQAPEAWEEQVEMSKCLREYQTSTVINKEQLLVTCSILIKWAGLVIWKITLQIYVLWTRIGSLSSYQLSPNN